MPPMNPRTQPSAPRQLRWLGLWLLTCASLPTAPAQTGPVGTLFTVPTTTFYKQVSGESVVTLNDTSETITGVQTQINSLRTQNPTKVIVINLKANGRYLVDTTPLVLGTNMCLNGAGATLAATSASITATCLMKISDGSSYTSVSYLKLEGNSANVYGIEANRVSRVNIDKVRTRATGLDGVKLQGLGSDVFDNECTITRCDTAGATNAAGVRILDTTQVVYMDNKSHDNLEGIVITNSSRAVIANNTIANNSLNGLSLPDTSWCSIVNNQFTSNPTAVATNASASTTTGSQRNIIASNNFTATTTGIQLLGIGNILYDNTFDSTVTTPLAASGASNNHVVVTTQKPLNAGSQGYFYPPTIANFHNSTVVTGKARVDLSTAATRLSEIQALYDAARLASPDAVIVLRLTAPVITGDAPLVPLTNTCIVIDGTINLEPGIAAISTGDLLAITYNISVSGGTIDGKNTTGRNGFAFLNCARVLVDHVSLRNFGSKTTRVDGSDIIAFSKGGNPCIVGYCTLDGGAARGIWSKDASARFIFTNNTVSNVNMDGIDFDAFSKAGLAKFNVLTGNIRTGIFVEESAQNTQLIANTANTNDIAFNVYSYAAGPTAYNTLVANKANGNQRGIRMGARTGYATEHNFAFNNSIQTTSPNGAIDSQNVGTENYFSQNHLASNTTPIAATNSAVFFNSPCAAANTAPILLPIANQSLQEDGPGLAVSLTLDDMETEPSVLTMSSNSTSTVLFPNDKRVFSVTGGNQVLTLTPAQNQNGSATVTVSASDGQASASASFNVTVTPDAPLTNWKQLYFGYSLNGLASANDLDDPDGDGLPNLLEYAMGGNPVQASTSPLSTLGTSGARLTLAFTRDTTKTDVNVIAQGADEAGGPWSTLAQSTLGSSFTAIASGATVNESGTGTLRTVQVGDSYTLPDNNHPKRFLRVKVQH